MNCRLAGAVIAIAMVVAACGNDPSSLAVAEYSEATTSNADAAGPGADTSTSHAPTQQEPTIDGEPDCSAVDGGWSMQASLGPDAVGAPTPEEEINGFLAAWANRFGGDIVHIRQGVGALVVDGAEVVVAVATPAPAGGWIVSTTVGCEGFQM